jgi:murein DD-endopeptidase MepM/ murein hydrolase activator NlpD
MAVQKKDEKWYRKLRSKYRLVIFNDTTFEERFSFRLTRLNVLIFIFSLGVVFITLTFFIIAYTPIKIYIPGYPDVDQKKELYSLSLLADSLIQDARQKNTYLQNIKDIISGEDVGLEDVDSEPEDQNYDSIVIRKSVDDSLLRAEFESQNLYNLNVNETGQISEANQSSIRSFNFFAPVNGIITSGFDSKEKHFGVDIAASPNEAVKATLDGTVIYADWTIETGHVIAIQHRRNLISVYKHNSILLKNQGDYAKAGEPIAVTGQSGELATGPHLHFELWYNGTPVNPEDYIIF